MSTIVRARGRARRAAEARGHRMARMYPSPYDQTAWFTFCTRCGRTVLIEPLASGEWKIGGGALRLSCSKLKDETT